MVTYTEEYKKYLRELEEKNKQNNERKPGGYFSIYDKNGEVREDGRCRMIEQYGYAGL
jgi:hypothetical protein